MDESPTVPAVMKDLLERPIPGHFVTVRTDGYPDSSPWWFLYDGENLKVTHNKSHRFFENLSANPRVAVEVNDPDDPYRYLEVRGEVVSIDDDEQSEFYVELSAKYMETPREKTFVPGRVVLTVKPTYTTSYNGSMGPRKADS